MIYMLDTNILIYLIKNKPPGIAARINALDKHDELSMSFLTYAELLKGAERSTRKAPGTGATATTDAQYSG